MRESSSAATDAATAARDGSRRSGERSSNPDWRTSSATSSLVLAALACDGWRAGELQRALLFPPALPGAVVRELARLVDDAAGHSSNR